MSSLSLTECVELCYKSSAIAYSSANRKRRICADWTRRFRDEAKETKSEEARRKRLMFADLWTAFRYQHNFFGHDAYGSGIGIKEWIEKCWVAAGHDLNDLLPIWEKYQKIRVFEHYTFTHRPTWTEEEIEEFEDDYAQEDRISVDDDWKDVYKKLLNHLVQDTWREIGMMNWLKENLDRDGHSEYVFTATTQQGRLDEVNNMTDPYEIWDAIMKYGQQFFNESGKCVANIDMWMKQEESVDATMQALIMKYAWDESNRPIGAGGIFVVHRDSLDETWRNRIESVDISYD